MRSRAGLVSAFNFLKPKIAISSASVTLRTHELSYFESLTFAEQPPGRASPLAVSFLFANNATINSQLKRKRFKLCHRRGDRERARVTHADVAKQTRVNLDLAGQSHRHLIDQNFDAAIPKREGQVIPASGETTVVHCSIRLNDEVEIYRSDSCAPRANSQTNKK
jgi:hypothetical protein